MTISKAVANFKAGEIVGLTFPTLGCQWAMVESVEVGETETKITVKLAKRFGSRITSQVFENEKRLTGQDFETFKKWLDANKINDFF